jgi:hypothetical protein
VSRYRTNTKKPINKKKKYREGGPVGEPVMLDEVDVVAPKFKPKGLFKGIRERFARNIHPVGYNYGRRRPLGKRLMDTVVRDIPENIAEPRYFQGSLLERKALLDLSMGQPVREEAIGALSVSDYRPSSSTDNDSPYLRSKATEDEIVYNYLADPDSIDFLNERINDSSDGKFLSVGGGVLGNYTVSRGEDENGTYLSYYDVWDLNPAEKIPGVRDVVDGAQSLAGINPPEVYGRIYVDKDDKGNVIGYKARQPEKSKRYRNETKEDKQER